MSFQPSNVEVYPEKSPCGSSRASELAPPLGFVCSDGRHLDRNYQTASSPCPGSAQQPARGASSCQTPASLSRAGVQRALAAQTAWRALPLLTFAKHVRKRVGTEFNGG